MGQTNETHPSFAEPSHTLLLLSSFSPNWFHRRSKGCSCFLRHYLPSFLSRVPIKLNCFVWIVGPGLMHPISLSPSSNECILFCQPHSQTRSALFLASNLSPSATSQSTRCSVHSVTRRLRAPSNTGTLSSVAAWLCCAAPECQCYGDDVPASQQ